MVKREELKLNLWTRMNENVCTNLPAAMYACARIVSKFALVTDPKN